MTDRVNDLARWIVEHGADRPVNDAEIGVPLYLPMPELPADTPTTDYEINYEI